MNSLTSPRDRVRSYGAAKEVDTVPRASDDSDQGYAFHFSEKLYESNDKDYDAILLLGARLNHYTGNMNNILSFLWSGFSKKSKVIRRLFIKEISVTYSLPSFENLNEEQLDYTGRLSTVGTVDNGLKDMPDLASQGVLAELRTINGYHFSELYTPSNGEYLIQQHRSWIHINLSPLKWVYEDLETTPMLSFYLHSINFDAAKPAWVFWKVTAGVKYIKGAALGGVEK